MSFLNKIRFTRDQLLSTKEVVLQYAIADSRELLDIFMQEKLPFYRPVKALQPKEGKRGATSGDDVVVYCEKYENYDSILHGYSMALEIDRLYVAKKDIESLAQKYEDLTCEPAYVFDSISAETEIGKRNQEIAQLKTTIADLRSQLDACWTEPPTAAAVAGKAKKTAESWAEYLTTAVRLASHCLGNPKEYTQQELEEACLENDFGTLTREAFKAFRKGMPSHLIKKPGAPSQGGNSS